MDPITSAIVAALTAGALGALTDTSKTAITNAYQHLKELLARKFGARSQIPDAIASLETRPDSKGRQETLQEEIAVAKAVQDREVEAAAKQLLALVQTQSQDSGKFTIHNNAPVQGQAIGNQNTVTQNFGNPPRA